MLTAAQRAAIERGNVLVEGISADDYHADPCPEPSLSASIARVINDESPLHAFTRHPRFSAVEREDSEAFDLGTALHKLLLGAGAGVCVIDAKDWRTNDTKAARALARGKGLVPMLAGQYDRAQTAAETVREKFAALGYVLDGRSEVAAFWSERDDDGHPVRCRSLIDHLKGDGQEVWDLKSTGSAHPESCRKKIEDLGYDIQRAGYTSGIGKISPHLAGRVDFVLLFFEVAKPFDVLPVRLSGAGRELGDRRWRRAVNAWSRGVRSGIWPGYAQPVESRNGAPWAAELDPPPWALRDDFERNGEDNRAAMRGEEA